MNYIFITFYADSTVQSYLADITTEETRTSRISLFTGITMLSGPIGNFVSGYIYHYGGHLSVWLSSIGCLILSLLYLVFFLAESRSKAPVNIKSDTASSSDSTSSSKQSEFIPNLLSILKNLLLCFTVTFRPRPGYRRLIIVLLLTMMCILIFSDCT